MDFPSTRLITQVLAGFVLAAIAVFLVFTYGLDIDLTLAARYHFVYFPAVIVLLGAALANCWEEPEKTNLAQTFKIPNSLRARGKKVVGAVWLMGLIGALTVVSNLGYQKSRRPELLVSQIQSMSDAPVLIATEHQTHSETRALMAIAWEFKHLEPSPRFDLTFSPPQFLLAHEKDNDSQSATAALYDTLAQQKRPREFLAKRRLHQLPKNHHCWCQLSYHLRRTQNWWKTLLDTRRSLLYPGRTNQRYLLPEHHQQIRCLAPRD